MTMDAFLTARFTTLQSQKEPLSPMPIKILDTKDLPESLKTCTEIGKGSEGIVFKCNERAIKFFHCVQETYPFRTPKEIQAFWQEYYGQIAPQYATATLTDARRKFPEKAWDTCNHKILDIPFIPSRPATFEESQQAFSEYGEQFNKCLLDPCTQNVLYSTELQKPVIIDFGQAALTRYRFQIGSRLVEE